MYGLVNQAVKDLVLTRYGAEVWAQIATRAGVQIDPFLAMHPYPEDVTDRLITAAAEILELSTDQVLQVFGGFWLEYSAEHGYLDLLDLMGEDLPGFLRAVDGMHDRLRLSYPDLNPPTIWCTDITPTSLTVHYLSDRPGLTPFLTGLLGAAARRFGQEADVRLVRSRQDGHDHDEFLVRHTTAA
jgi:hypothetical protein